MLYHKQCVCVLQRYKTLNCMQFFINSIPVTRKRNELANDPLSACCPLPAAAVAAAPGMNSFQRRPVATQIMS